MMGVWNPFQNELPLGVNSPPGAAPGKRRSGHDFPRLSIHDASQAARGAGPGSARLRPEPAVYQ